LIQDDPAQALQGCDVLIDFTRPEATLQHLALCRELGVKLVVGTTGFSTEQKQLIRQAADDVSIMMAPNMSVGVNVMWKIIADAAKLLGSSFDIEVLETHHKLKKDAPSGTAMTTAEVLAQATGRDLARDAVYHREGLIGERQPNEIGIQTLRGGDVVGDHTVFFLGNGERLEITHRATSRDTFAMGSIRAAQWVVGQKPGLYHMKDVLGLLTGR
jgi:4-hydroxy-tetrahydrodipicolinate reductase